MKNKYEIVGDIVFIHGRCKGRRMAIIVSLSQFPIVESYTGTWQIVEENHTYYALRKGISPRTGRRTNILMHRFLMDMGDSAEQIDHINGNGLDNRDDNLRAVTVSENQQNQHHLRPDNTSGITGVNFHRRTRTWRARIQINGQQKTLGYYNSKEEASAARREAELKYFNCSPLHQDII